MSKIIIDDAKNYTTRMLELLYEHNQGVLSYKKGKAIIAYKSLGKND